MHCKPRTMRVVSIETADRWGMGAMPLGAEKFTTQGYSYINLTENRNNGAPASSMSLAVKNDALGKFPGVGETITTDLFLRAGSGA